MKKAREAFIEENIGKIRQAAKQGDIALGFEAVAEALEELVAEEVEDDARDNNEDVE